MKTIARKRKSVRRKSVRRKSVRRKSVRRKSVKRGGGNVVCGTRRPREIFYIRHAIFDNLHNGRYENALGMLKDEPGLINQKIRTNMTARGNKQTILHRLAYPTEFGVPGKIRNYTKLINGIMKTDNIGSIINSQDENGDTPMHILIKDCPERAWMQYRQILATALGSAGVDLNIRNNEGNTVSVLSDRSHRRACKGLVIHARNALPAGRSKPTKPARPTKVGMVATSPSASGVGMAEVPRQNLTSSPKSSPRGSPKSSRKKSTNRSHSTGSSKGSPRSRKGSKIRSPSIPVPKENFGQE